MIRTAQHNGVEITFITQPYLWKAQMTDQEISQLYAGGVAPTDEWPNNPSIKWYRPEAMMVMLNAYNDVTRSVCSQHRLKCVDLERELPKQAKNFYDDFHFSEAGANAVSEIIYRELNAGSVH